ncbi:hypothetical protein [Kitasatospora sp. NPDC056731]|uniref:hypothetical protein n=1 Tax=Kitasatospora sp. NPDC056731 TaxID=3155422 RepID=UPI00343D78F0
MADRLIWVVRVFNPDGTPYLTDVDRAFADAGVQVDGFARAAYSEAQRDEMVANARSHGLIATAELAPECRGL